MNNDVTVVFTEDYSNRKAGEESIFSIDIAKMLVEQGVAYIKEDSSRPVAPRPTKPSKFGQKPELENEE